MSKRAATTVERHIDELVRADAVSTSPDAETARWAAGLDGRIREKLEGWGLVKAIQRRNTDADRLLGPFIDRYIIERTDIKPGTADNFHHAKRLLLEMFAEETPLTTITEGDAARWKRQLLARPVKWDEDGKVTATMAPATVSKHIKRAKTMFTAALADRLIEVSPFDAVAADGEVNRDRDYILTPAETSGALAACPDVMWKSIYALARFGGLRACEVLAITWGDVLWDVGKVRIDSPKTGLRFCPLFPELEPILRDGFEAAEEGTVHVVGKRYRRGSNLGTIFRGILERGGVTPWPKPLQNLRLTRRNELEATHPNH
ncbi:MAG: hypothetical protein AAGD07_21175, partial [Planctomycetota bacterium]